MGAYPSAFPAGGAGLKPHRATLELVLGILGVLCCNVLSIPAFVMSRSDIAAMDAGLMDPSGRTTANIARILGIIGMVFLGLSMLYLVAVLAFGGSSGGLA